MRYFSSTAVRTSLTADVTSSQTTFAVAAVAGFPAQFPYTLIVDQNTVNEELVEVTGRSGTTLTIVRGVDGTTAVAHASGAVVEHGVSARDYAEAQSHIAAATGVHGVAGALAAASDLAAKADTSAVALKADIKTEPFTGRSISANVLTADLATGNLSYVGANPTANFTVNVTNADYDDWKMTTVTLFVVQGATGYIPNAIQVNGQPQPIKWQGGTAPTPTSTAGKIDVFSFTLIRRFGSWEVLGSALVKF